MVVGSCGDFIDRAVVDSPAYRALAMWSLLELVADFFGAIFVEWRFWKWIHDPPLKGDPPRDKKKP